MYIRVTGPGSSAQVFQTPKLPDRQNLSKVGSYIIYLYRRNIQFNYIHFYFFISIILLFFYDSYILISIFNIEEIYKKLCFIEFQKYALKR